MPTPFNHLAAAQALLEHPHLADPVRERLLAARPAFLLGHVAPDFVTVAGLDRETSHFFRVPMAERMPAHVRLFRAHPRLRRASGLGAAHAAFIAGYIAHLWLDQAWIASLFEPYYGPEVPRGTFRERLIDHNLLRAYLDLDDLDRLGPEVGSRLREAEPSGWLPFAMDEDLRTWRDNLADQLAPGGVPQTISVFSRRVGLPPDQFAARLGSEEEMERAAFALISKTQLQEFQRQSLLHLAELTNLYLAGSMDQPGSAVNRPFADMRISRERVS